MVTKKFRVYGRREYNSSDRALDTYHRQKLSFAPSTRDDFSRDGITRILEIRNSDITGTNAYSEVIITRDTAADCYEELSGQLSDGAFENYRYSDVMEVVNGIEIEVT